MRTRAEGHLRVSRWSTWLVCVGLVLLNVVQPSRETTFDTKLDLVVDPVGWLGRATRMWNPDQQLGLIQNQAYGYLFPIGPYFALGDLLHAPDWLWQRLWSGLVLALAFEGARRLVGRTVPQADQWVLMLAGLTYALAPRLLGTVGVLSGEALPGAILPWTVLPLVMARGRSISWTRASIWSAATVPLMGGHNATEVLLILPLPALVILTSPQTLLPRLRTVALWSGLVALGTAWWMLPLLLMGAYSPPFLDYIETAHNVTAGVGWFETLRGATHWVANASPEVTHWYGAHELVTSPWSVWSFTALSAVGLMGLTVRGVVARRAFGIAVLGAILLLVAGHDGGVELIMKQQYLALLDGVGAPFRNIHKLDPIVRLAVAIGLANSVAHSSVWLGRRLAPFSVARVLQRLPAAAAALACLIAAFPAGGQLRDPDGWSELPASWTRAAAIVAEDKGQALIVPATGASIQTWGRTVDEVLQAQRGVAFASFGQAPLAPPATTRLLERLDTLIVSGRHYPNLGEALARAGFTHVVLRNDLIQDGNSLNVARARATLRDAPGIRRVLASGQVSGGGAELEVYRVDTAAPFAEVTALHGTRGSPGIDAGAVASRRATGEETGSLTSATGASSQLVTDGVLKRERAFGRVSNNVSHIRGPLEQFDLHRRAPDYLPDAPLVTFADYGWIKSVNTSSGQSRADNFGAVDAAVGPWAALDSDPDTAWLSGTLLPGVGQWFEVAFDRPRAVHELSVDFGTFGVSVPSRVALHVDGGTIVRDVPRNGRLEVLGLPHAPTETVRVEFLSTGTTTGPVAITGIRFGDTQPRRSIVVPAQVRPYDAVSFSSDPGSRTCFDDGDAVRCAVPRASDESEGLMRSFTTTGEGSWVLSGKVVSTAEADPARLFRPVGATSTVTASSTYANDPRVNATFAADGDEGTSWYASPFDGSPSLTFTWDTPRTVGEITVTAGARPVGESPTKIVVRRAGRSDELTLSGGKASFTPVKTSSISVQFPTSGSGRAVSVAEVGFTELELGPMSLPLSSASGAICGLGPEIEVNGRTIPTRVAGSLSDVADGAPLELSPCAEPIQLAAGKHDLRVVSLPGFQPISLTLTPAGGGFTAMDPVPAPVRSSEGGSRYVVEVAGGADHVLSIAQSANAGWHATSAGVDLSRTVVDGWKQGFFIPASDRNSNVVIEFSPSGLYRTFLGVAALGPVVLLLLLLKCVVRRRESLDSETITFATPVRRSHPYGRPSQVVFVLGAASAVIVAPVFGVAACFGLLSSRQAWVLVVSGFATLGAVMAWTLDAPWITDVGAAIAVGVLAPGLIRRIGS